MKITDNRFLVVLSLLIFAWAVVYKDALVGMEAIWSRSDTFAHGHFILPISLWLLWRDKRQLLLSTVQPSLLALLALAVSLFAGLFAYAADINVLEQLSAVASLIFLLWMLLGNKLTWRYKFPLAYLLFAVPMGENLIPWLQDVTAWFTVFFLKLNGIPVYVDGLYIQIPTGMFEVAVACSGIRYLIASAAVGALYGYLTYQKTHKQIIFFIFALLLPILANGIRAYGIVAIAYYSDMEYATGADHLIYGWLFFGLIIMLMFWIGGFFADKVAVEDKLETSNKALLSVQDGKILLIPLLSLPLLLCTLLLLKDIPVLNLTEESSNKVQNNLTSWGIRFDDAFESNLTIENSGLEKFNAVYGNKQDKGELISWENVTHNHNLWTIVASDILTIANKPVKLVHLRDKNGKQRSYLYQYKIGNFYSVSDNIAKLRQAWNSLSRQSDFSEIRAISISGKNVSDELKNQLTREFTNSFYL